MNNENLKPFNTLTESKQREIAQKGGIKSSEVRRKKKEKSSRMAGERQEKNCLDDYFDFEIPSLEVDIDDLYPDIKDINIDVEIVDFD